MRDVKEKSRGKHEGEFRWTLIRAFRVWVGTTSEKDLRYLTPIRFQNTLHTPVF